MKCLSKNAANKLRAGQTVWRCLILESGKVDIEEIFLSGPKTITSFAPNYTSKKIGHRHLGDLVRVPCFTRRKDALKFQSTVNEPQFAQLRKHAENHWIECASWDLIVWD